MPYATAPLGQELSDSHEQEVCHLRGTLEQSSTRSNPTGHSHCHWDCISSAVTKKKGDSKDRQRCHCPFAFFTFREHSLRPCDFTVNFFKDLSSSVANPLSAACENIGNKSLTA